MTAYTFDKVKVTPAVQVNGVTSVLGFYELTGALADNDTIGSIPVPDGAIILKAEVTCSELDTNGSPTLTLNVGDSTDEDRFVDGATTGAAVNIQGINVSTVTSNAVATGKGYTYSDSSVTTGLGGEILITVDGSPATAATTGHVILEVQYTLDAY